MKLFSRKEKGFTLIELLVVIAIIGILAGIVLVSLGGARTSARDARRQSDIRQITTAQELFYNDTVAYVASATMPTAIGTYLVTVPRDPGTGAPAYQWRDNSAATGDYCVFALLEASGAAANIHYAFLGGPGGVTKKDIDTDGTDGISALELAAVTLTACE